MRPLILVPTINTQPLSSRTRAAHMLAPPWLLTLPDTVRRASR